MVNFIPKFKSLLILSILFFSISNLFSQSNGDYRTRDNASGNWTGTNIWQRYNDGWTDVDTYPTSSDGAIEVRSDANITINSSITLDQVTVNGILTISADVTINDGTGTDFLVSSDGTVNWTSGNITLNTGPATLQIDGIFDIQSGAGTFTGQTNGTTINGTLRYGKSESNSYPNNNGSGNYTDNYTSYGSNGTLQLYSYCLNNYFHAFLGNSSTVFETLRNLTFNSTNAGSNYYSIFASGITTIAGKLKIENTSSDTGKGFVLAYLTTERKAGSLEITGGNCYVLKSDAGGNRTFTSEGNISISGGTLIIAENSSYTGTLNCKGNFTHTGGSIKRTAGTAYIIFNGTSNQDIESTGFSGAINITFQNNITVPSGKTFIIPNGGTFQGTTGKSLTVYGTLLHQGTVPTTMNGSGILINNATYIHNTTSAATKMVDFFSTKESNSNWIYRGSSSLAPAVSLAGNTFGNLSFESTSGSWQTNFTGTYGFTANGNFTLGSGVTLNTTNTGTSYIKGNFTINGTLKIDSNNQNFTFNGSQEQKISGTSNINFNNLTINNSNGVKLETNITINKSLTMTSGLLYTGISEPYDSYKITFGTNATNPSESSASRIVGVAEMSARSVGTGSINFLNCNIASGTDNIGNVTIKRYTGPCGIIEINGNRSIACHWLVTVDNQPTNGRDVTYSWLSDLDNGKNFSSTNKAEFWVSEDKTNWIKKGEGFDVSGSNPRTMTVNTTNFSYWVASSENAPLPVELLSFNYVIKEKDVILKWITASEENNFGFEIERNSYTENIWTKIGFVEGKGTIKSQTNYEFADRKPDIGKYRYRLKQIDFNGNYQYFILNSLVEIQLPDKFELEQNYPNPFNNYTIISLICPIDENVKIKVYDITGREILTVIDSYLKQGSYNFKLNTDNLTSGIYFYTLTAGNTVITKRMVLIK